MTFEFEKPSAARVRAPVRLGPCRAHGGRAGWLALFALLAPALAAWTLGACQAPQTAQPTPRLAPALRAAFDARVQREAAAHGLVGLSVALAREGEIVHVVHVGFEDAANKVAASDATLYRWASISKPLTAVAAMQLSEEGRLDIERDVRAYVPEFPDKGTVISAKQLLCHQGGIVHYSNGAVLASPPRVNVEHPYADAVDALATFDRSPLVNAPGERFAYSTHGYMLLGAVVQRASGMPFHELVKQRIAAPLGMGSLGPDFGWIQVPHRTVGYHKAADGSIETSEDADVSWKLPGGGYQSSVLDLARFGAGMLEDRLVRRSTRDRMWTRQATNAGTQTNYGLGFEVSAWNGRDLIAHGGAQEKTRTRLVLDPTNGVAIAIMTNSEWADLKPLGLDLIDLFATLELAPR